MEELGKGKYGTVYKIKRADVNKIKEDMQLDYKDESKTQQRKKGKEVIYNTVLPLVQHIEWEFKFSRNIEDTSMEYVLFLYKRGLPLDEIIRRQCWDYTREFYSFLDIQKYPLSSSSERVEFFSEHKIVPLRILKYDVDPRLIDRRGNNAINMYTASFCNKVCNRVSVNTCRDTLKFLLQLGIDPFLVNDRDMNSFDNFKSIIIYPFYDTSCVKKTLLDEVGIIQEERDTLLHNLLPDIASDYIKHILSFV